MSYLTLWTNYLKTPSGRLSAVLVLVTSVVMGLFIDRTFVNRLPVEHYLAFTNASWIQAPHDTSRRASYFRKTLYITGTPRVAWVSLSATGNYRLYVNQVLVGQKSYPCVRVSGIYDIKHLLAPGKNVIGIYVAAGRFDGPAQIIVRGLYQLAASPSQQFVSDSSWKTALVPAGIVGRSFWYASSLQDRFWENAVQTDSRRYLSTVQPVRLDPRVLERPISAQWITPAQADAREASFGYDFDLTSLSGEAWLQVAANGAYDIVINGQLAVTQPLAPMAPLPQTPALEGGQAATILAPSPGPLISPNGALPGRELPAVRGHRLRRNERKNVAPTAVSAKPHGPRPTNLADFVYPLPDVDAPSPPFPAQATGVPPRFGMGAGMPLLIAYRITDWLKAGKNVIRIRVSPVDTTPALLADGYADANGSVKHIATGASWSVNTGERAFDGQQAGLGRPIVLTSYGTGIWGRLTQIPAGQEAFPNGTDASFEILLVITLASGIVLLLWFATPYLFSMLRSERSVRPDIIWTRGALSCLPALTLLCLAWLVACDVRLRSDWCYTPSVIALSLAAVLATNVAFRWTWASRRCAPGVAAGALPVHARRYWLVAALCAIALIGFAVRLIGLRSASLGQDEMTLIRYTQGVLKAGYPYMVTGSYTKLITTYELLPYPMALFAAVFGASDFVYRMPALLFGTLTILLVGWVGRRMISWPGGLAAALIYAFLPETIGWSRNAFYPSQETFFALATFWFFFEAIRRPSINGRYLIAASSTLLLTYFSWEGSGFIVPTLFVALLMVRRSWDWLWNRTLWRCLMAIAGIVLLQMCYRQLYAIPNYLLAGFDMGQVVTPTPVLLERLVFNPTYYLRVFFGAEDQVVLSALAIAGVWLCRRRTPVLYLGTCLITIIVIYTCFLPIYAGRYSFQATPLLVLTAVGTLDCIIRRLRALGRRQEYGRLAPLLVIIGYSWVALLILSANPFVLKTYRLSANPARPSTFARLGARARPDYRDAALYVGRHLRPGDTVVAFMPHIFEHYTGVRPGYSTNFSLSRRMKYDPGLATPRFTDKWLGVPMLRDLEELLDVQSRSVRVWLVLPTYPSFHLPLAVTTYLKRNATVAYEGNHQQVLLLKGVPAGVPLLSQARADSVP